MSKYIVTGGILAICGLFSPLLFALPQPPLSVCFCNEVQDKSRIEFHGKILWLPLGKEVVVNQYQVYPQQCITYVTSDPGGSFSLLNFSIGDKTLARRSYSYSVTVSYIGNGGQYSIQVDRNLGPRCFSVGFPVMLPKSYP